LQDDLLYLKAKTINKI